MSLLTQYLENSAKYFPKKIAIVINNQSINYIEYFNEANKLAHFLMSIGCQLGDRVAICLPKSFDLYISIQAILRTGACYIPLDPTIPNERLAFILKHSKAKILISLSGKILQVLNTPLDSINKQITVSVLNYNNQQIPIQLEAIFPLSNIKKKFEIKSEIKHIQAKITTQSPAYILYTSGSTGTPKGILHSHASASVFIEWAAQQINLTMKDIVSQYSTVSFDLSIFDIFSTLYVCATLVPVPENLFGKLVKIIQFIKETSITTWYSVPSVLLQNIDIKYLSPIPHCYLKNIIFAGECISKPLLKNFFSFIPKNCRLHNWYGPTETNVCTYHEISVEDLEQDTPIPIGEPCPYANITFQNQTDNKLQQKNIYELFVSGASLMTTYLCEDPKLAKEILNLKGTVPIYQTGDMVSYDTKGRLFFIGRHDNQIKINGYRIQLEEINDALERCPSISEAVTLVINNRDKQKLISVIVEKCGMSCELKEIIMHCSKILPHYMIPSLLIKINMLPRTSRGKVDYYALKNIIQNKV